MRSVICSFVLFYSLTCTAQSRSTTVELSDISAPKQQFIAFKGKMTFSEHVTNGRTFQKQDAVASGEILSARPIVAFVAIFEWYGFGGGRSASSARHDQFFSSHDFVTGDTVDFIVPQGNVMSTDSSSSAAGGSEYTVDLKFVQFADGSIWRDKSIGDELAAQRADMIAYMEHLLSEYGAGNEQSFVTAMNLPPVPREHQKLTTAFALQKRLQMVHSESGTATAIELIKQQLNFAATRMSTGNFQQ
jgi:hypothetical protein